MRDNYYCFKIGMGLSPDGITETWSSPNILYSWLLRGQSCWPRADSLFKDKYRHCLCII